VILIERYCSAHGRTLDHLYPTRNMVLLSVSRMRPSAVSLFRLSVSDQAWNFIGIGTEAWPLVPSELPQPDHRDAGLMSGQGSRYGGPSLRVRQSTDRGNRIRCFRSDALLNHALSNYALSNHALSNYRS
jgi:hypothetical protein